MKHLLMYYSIFEPSSGANPQDSSISLASYMLFSTHKLNKYLFAITSVSPLLVIIFPCQQAHRLHMRTNSNYIPTKLWISGQYFYSTNTVRAAFSHKIMDGTNFATY